MAKKDMKAAAAAGTSVFDQIASGNVTDVQNVQDVQNTKNVKKVQKTEKVPMERLNLKIPTELKEYLNVAAAQMSIEQRRNVSLTEYLCGLIKADMEKK